MINVLIPQGYKPPKKDVEAAWILARYYKTTINIIQPSNRYKVKTPDYKFLGEFYELKVITSRQVRQLLVQLEHAKKQAQNIVIDLRKSKITTVRAQEICEKFLMRHPQCKILIIVTAKSVIEIRPQA